MATTQQPEFTVGKTYYARDGQMLELLAFTTDEQFVCAELFEVDTYEGERQTVWCNVVFQTELYASPPRKLIDAEVAALREEANSLREKNAAARREVLKAEAEVAQRLKTLSAYDGLERLEDFIAGKVTHVVVENYDGAKVIPFSELQQVSEYYRKPEGIKLISLFGDTAGKLTWRVNQYKDGSGSNWSRMEPATSEDEANVILRRWIVEDLAHAAVEAKAGRHWYALRSVKAAIDHGVPVPAEQQKLYDELVEKDRLRRIEELEKSKAKTSAELEALYATAPATHPAA